jgi:hypothetical protein
MAHRNTMFKSCDYCRHRKKRCVILPGAAARCSDCQHLDLACEFSPRLPSEKRRVNARQIAARVGSSASALGGSQQSPDSNGREHEVEEANLKPGDCQLPLAGRRDMANKRLFTSRSNQPVFEGSDGPPSLSELYWRDVHPFWPFATPEMLDRGEAGRFPDFMRCVDLACRLSLNLLEESEDLSTRVKEVKEMLRHPRLSMPTIAGALLLSAFLDLDDELLQRVCARMNPIETIQANHHTRYLTVSSTNTHAALILSLRLSWPEHFSPTSGDDSLATPIHLYILNQTSYSNSPKRWTRKASVITICASPAMPPSLISCA